MIDPKTLEIPIRECRICKEIKYRYEFGLSKNSHDGWNIYCKACSKKKAKERREKNQINTGEKPMDWHHFNIRNRPKSRD